MTSNIIHTIVILSTAIKQRDAKAYKNTFK